jgi:tellurite methyltransferase
MTRKDIAFNKGYWDSFYKSNHKHTPSQFCVCVLTEIPEDAIIVELGSGNGRDAHYFASQGHETIAMDLSHQAVKSCIDLSKSRNLGHLTFFQGDLTSKESIQKTVDHAREKAGKKDIVFYSRFVIHSIDDEQELMFLEILSNCLRPDELVYFEFRSKEDSDLKKHYGGHFRRYVDTDDFKNRLINKFGFVIDYIITGKGMAKFKEEDPFVSRLIVRKKSA